MIAPATFERLKNLVVEKTGHHYYVDKDRLLLDRVRERMQARNLSSLAEYLVLLEGDNSAEWRALENVITVGETYFFRYPDHFAAMRNRILPSLIAARRETRHLRIWCVGCSNGAEPYSVAIVLRELLGASVDDWRIALIGGDISEKALAAAQSGRYSAWALRTMGPEDRARYFDQDGSIWVLKPEYRRMVRFERQNILDLLSPVPPIEWSDFDLVLCRNVLIYFSPRQAVEITAALRRSLARDGELILGHAEATLASDPDLLNMPRLTSEFRQALAPTPAYVPPELPPLPATLVPAPKASPAAAPISHAEGVDEIQHLADAGAYEEAARLCRELIAHDPTSVRLQYYDAVLRQVLDDASGAEAALKRALYLDRSFVLAHHRLGMLLLALGRKSDARRSLLTAARLAEAAPASEPLPEGHGVLAGDFLAALRRQLIDLGSAA